MWKYHGKAKKNHGWVDFDLRPPLFKIFRTCCLEHLAKSKKILNSACLLVDVDPTKNHYNLKIVDLL